MPLFFCGFGPKCCHCPSVLYPVSSKPTAWSEVYVIIMKGFQEKTLRAKALFIQYSEVTFLYNSKVEIACTTECIIYVEFMKVNDIEFWVQLLGFCVERVESGLTPLCSFVRP